MYKKKLIVLEPTGAGDDSDPYNYYTYYVKISDGVIGRTLGYIDFSEENLSKEIIINDSTTDKFILTDFINIVNRYPSISWKDMDVFHLMFECLMFLRTDIDTPLYNQDWIYEKLQPVYVKQVTGNEEDESGEITDFYTMFTIQHEKDKYNIKVRLFQDNYYCKLTIERVTIPT